MNLKNAFITLLIVLFAIPAAIAAPAGRETALKDWPRIKSAIPKDPALEKRAADIVSRMTLAQKIGQMTQPEIKTATPADVKTYYLGSVLNGGGSWPNGNKYATPADWVALADQYHDASMSTDMAVKVPVIWGIDAMHGNSNIHGATLFPHNIGLGAARNEKLIGQMAESVGKAVRATGISWVFAPTVAVVRDDRWGRTYEGFAEDPALVSRYASAYVKGLQAGFKRDTSVVATAKHFIGDGGTHEGKDQGDTKASVGEMINIHGRGYFTALNAGAQTVMVSFNSWTDTGTGTDQGKLHGSKVLVTDVLKTKMGFDGFVVSDWNGIEQVKGCAKDSCAQAINAGIDMMMVPDDWKAFIANTIKQVERGEIPMARIDDAVTRIIRVKLRAGLFDAKPSRNPHAGKPAALQARALARQAVRESLVLLKNDGGVLPLSRGKKILVVGKSADDMPNQTGGWTLTWQGTDNKNSDFPNGDTILAGIVEAVGAANVTFSANAKGVDVSRFDAVVAVIGETPYAEMMGDIGPAGTLRHSGRYPEDLAVLQAVAGKGKPVVTVMVAGRALYTNDLMNLSDAFVAAWLPGSEGKGIADVLFRKADGKVNHDFKGKLSFSWPKSVCQTPLNVGDKGYAPLFAYGYGLKYGSKTKVGKLEDAYSPGGCGVTNAYPVRTQADRMSWPLYVTSGTDRVALGSDVNAVFTLPTAKVDTAQVNTQQDGARVAWSGAATLEARAATATPLPDIAIKDGALQFDTIASAEPQGVVTLTMGCGTGCAGSVDVTSTFKRIAGKARQTVKIPLACFVKKGTDLKMVDVPFSVSTDKPFTAAFANIQIVGGAAKDADVVNCAEAP
jgi:beta-glucosidase